MKRNLLFYFAIFISIGTAFSQNAIAIPDRNFEQALIDHGYDTNGLNGNILKTDARAVKILHVNGRNISSLKGIEGFIDLTVLDCSGNELTSLDVGKNTKLIELLCHENRLTSLDVGKNTKLIELLCHENRLTSLDVSKNTELTLLWCSSNNLTSLDLSKNTKLDALFCNKNNLTSLDVSKNTELYWLFCEKNNLTSLDVSKNTKLTQLDCRNNELTALNVKNGNNSSIISFWATSNPDLSCIEVDDPSWSTTNWENIDPTASFSEDCGTTTDSVHKFSARVRAAEDVLETSSIIVYPNPFKAEVNVKVSNQQTLKDIQVFTIQGELLKETRNSTIEMQQFPAGIYFLKIQTDKGIVTKKIIKE